MNEDLIRIIEDRYFDRFTISELKAAYLELSGEPCPFKARKYIYKQTLRLLRLNLVSKVGHKYSHNAIYLKTDLFGDVRFISTPLKKRNKTRETFTKLISPLPVSTNTELNTLIQYKVEMMSAIGEIEEYIRLLKAYPEMETELTSDYHNAKDKKAKLLGQIKAINTLLSYKSSK